MRALAAVLVAACGASPTGSAPRSIAPLPRPQALSPIANVAPAAPPISHAPFAILGRLVDEDGRVVRTLPGVGEADVAEPVGSDRYRIHGQMLDATTGALTPERVPAAIATVDSHQEAYALERYRADGAAAWTVPLHGWRSVRPPEIAVGGGRVVISFAHDVRAFAAVRRDDRGVHVRGGSTSCSLQVSRIE